MFQYISPIFDEFLTKCLHKIKKSDIIITLFALPLFLFYLPFFAALKNNALLRFFLLLLHPLIF